MAVTKAKLGQVAALLYLSDQKSKLRLQTALVVFGGLGTFAFCSGPERPTVDTSLGRIGALI